jgi:2-polyprenyl-3-methyl-5-hydroxy-6-metoxy-1,4-benzoquinol methylase
MDTEKQALTQQKFILPYHWMRDPYHRDSLPYFGYAKIILEELPRAPAAILDAGCGDGRISYEIAQAGHQVTGLEYLANNVYYAGLLVPQGRFFQADLGGDIDAIECLAPDSFDAAVLVEVYEHIPPEKCARALANLRHLIKPGGRLIISVPTIQLPMSKLHYRHFKAGQCEAELCKAGFELNKVIGQHALSAYSRWLLSNFVERSINNGVLEPVVLNRIRQRIYMRNFNRVDPEQPCGRFIIVAHKA